MGMSGMAELEAPPPSGADSMAEREQPRKSAAPAPKAGVDAAFEIWLHRGLHQLYDSVAQEPVPDELLKLIEADRSDKTGR